MTNQEIEDIILLSLFESIESGYPRFSKILAENGIEIPHDVLIDLSVNLDKRGLIKSANTKDGAAGRIDTEGRKYVEKELLPSYKNATVSAKNMSHFLLQTGFRESDFRISQNVEESLLTVSVNIPVIPQSFYFEVQRRHWVATISSFPKVQDEETLSWLQVNNAFSKWALHVYSIKQKESKQYSLHALSIEQDDQELGKLGFTVQGITGYVYLNQVEGARPIFQFVSEIDPKKFFYTFNPDSEDLQKNKLIPRRQADTWYLMSEGLPGTLPLRRFFKHDENSTGDHFYSATPDISKLHDSKYSEEQGLGYVFTEPADDRVKLYVYSTAKDLLFFEPLPEIKVRPVRPKRKNPELFKTQTRAHSDAIAKEDLLGYKVFADTLVGIIKEKKSAPPLNIAIIAPWGHGKSTLMSFMREGLEEPVIKNDNTNNVPKTTFKTLMNWLDSGKKTETEKRLFPTVWFNPWKYQNSQQLWSGLGHSIINQLVEKLSLSKQEAFWFDLQLSRIDKSAIRRDVHAKILEKGLGWFIFLSLGFLVGTVLLFKYYYLGSISAISLLGIVVNYFHSRHQVLKSEVDGLASKYLRSPNYGEGLGMYHHLTEDLKFTFSKLIAGDAPAVIFIDDLDRCSPSTVAEVMESINLIISNPELGSHCYFVIGMDAKMVAASLDKAYESLHGKFIPEEKRYGSIGWFFLDKFIQLPFFIPTMDSSQKDKFLHSLFQSDNPQPKTSSSLTEEEIKQKAEAAADMENAQVKTEVAPEVVNDQRFKSAFIDVKMKKYESEPESLLETIKAFSPYINSSPRDLKRFANLLRFYSSYQDWRKTFKSDEGYASTNSLAKWLILMLRWPEFVRWIQWEHDFKVLDASSAPQKAKKVDSAIHPKSKKTNLKEVFGFTQDDKVPKWADDVELLSFLHINSKDDSKLENALKYEVW